MSGVLRLSNNVTGRSTINASASNDQTYTLPALGGTLVTGGASSELIFPPGTEALPGLHVQGDVDTGLYAPAANTLGISTGGNERLRIDSSGRLLVGTTIQYGTANQASIHSAGKNTLSLIDTTAQTTNVGAALSLGGNYRSTGDAQAFVRISAVKENATDNNYSYGMQFDTSASGGFNFGTSAMRIDSSGRLLVGTTSARTYTTGGSGANQKVQVETAGATAVFTTLGIYSNSDVAGLGAYLELGRSKGTTLASTTSVALNDALGELRFAGTNGTGANTAASIAGYVDGVVAGGGTNDMPGRLVFSTTPDGAATPMERTRIDSSGDIYIGPYKTANVANNKFYNLTCAPYAWSGDPTQSELVRVRLGTNGTGQDDGYFIVETASNIASGGTLQERICVLPTGGITFNGDRALANALDDYEEGTWTPETNSTTQGTYAWKTGRYTLVGNLVTVWWDMQWSGQSGFPTQGRITGLPYASTASNLTGGYGAPRSRDANGVSANLRIYGESSYFSVNDILVQEYNSSGTAQAAQFIAAGRYTGWGQYFIN